MTRCLVLASFPGSLRNFRGPLIEAMLREGHEVHAAAPGLSADGATSEWLTARGVVCHDAPLDRTGLGPVRDLRGLIALVGLMRRIRPDLFLGYTIKPVIWGLIAAHFCAVPQRVALITGLGYAFTGEARGKRALVKRVVQFLYGLALRRATLIFFQNPDDRADFTRMSLIPSGIPVEVVNGSGVDVEAFAPAPLPDGPIRFLLIARLLGDKGIREYAAAAALVKVRWPDAEFHLVGGVDDNPNGIDEDEVLAWQAAGQVIWHGAALDVRPALAAAHVYVLPSYREGTPRTVLEAMAMARPVITTDAPGCRETVQPGINGLLVPVRDVPALASAMEHILASPLLIESMALASRRLAEEKYDVRRVNAAMIAAMALER